MRIQKKLFSLILMGFSTSYEKICVQLGYIVLAVLVRTYDTAAARVQTSVWSCGIL
jgi:hypothetical protein